MKNYRVLVLAAAVALAFAGCKQEADTATGATATAAAPEAGPAPETEPAPRPDVLKADQVSIALKQEGPVKASADGKSLEVPILVTNNGTAAISSELQPAVNVGVQILADDGTTTSPGGVQDYSRVSIPRIEPGASAKVLVTMPVDERIEGRKLTVGLVQETVAWFVDFGQPTLPLGPFKMCDGKVCDAEGKAL